MAELRARRLKLEASKAQLAEGEEILVKCNALCDRNGPVLSELYDASGAACRARLCRARARVRVRVQCSPSSATRRARRSNPNPSPNPITQTLPKP